MNSAACAENSQFFIQIHIFIKLHILHYTSLLDFCIFPQKMHFTEKKFYKIIFGLNIFKSKIARFVKNGFLGSSGEILSKKCAKTILDENVFGLFFWPQETIFRWKHFWSKFFRNFYFFPLLATPSILIKQSRYKWAPYQLLPSICSSPSRS